MNLREVAITTKLSEQNVRRAIKNGSLKATKVPINESQERYEITEEAVKEWRSTSGAHNTREDGRRKYVLYATTEEWTKAVTLLNKNGLKEVAELIRLANGKHNGEKETD